MVASLTAQLLAVSVLSLQRQTGHNHIGNADPVLPSYDYVVVGSGSAGAVVAHRLAQTGRFHVLLLEAGGPQSAVSDMPGLTTSLVGTEMDWQYRTVPQKNIGQAFQGRRIRQPKGKVIGGSSTLYWMLYNRGNRRSYDNWERVYGATGWNYRSVLPFFIRSENNSSPRVLRASVGYHGTSGPMAVSDIPHPDPILYRFQDQMNRFGIPSIDINGPSQSGTTIYQVNVNSRGTRSGTGNAYIDPNPYPDTLHILPNALVSRILFGPNSTATGVEYIHAGVTRRVNASREVIISAGCIGSPQLLMLSGIGPRVHLESLGIPVVADLPVGDNFQDHVFIHHYYRVHNRSLVNPLVGPTVQQLYDYYENQTGPLTQLPNSITFFSTPTNDDPEFPNAVIDVNPYSLPDNLTQATDGFEANLAEWEDYFRPHLGTKFVLITSAIYRTYSRGTVRLASTNPADPPLIDPRYLTDDRDIQALVDMTKILFYVTQTGEFTKYASLFPGSMPGCKMCTDVPLYQCDSYVRCIIRQVGDSALHPGGACRMGDPARSDVVVDPKLRVKNVNRLRVIDSSVIPELANANTNAASVMIGERGVQLILDQM